jgi:hypothetical protein
MTSQKDQKRIDDLSNMVDRLHRRLQASQAECVLLKRQLEIMQDRFCYDDEERDAVRRQALEE